MAGGVALGRSLSDGYFSEGAWASSGPLRFRHLTCLECGKRLATWARFREHRPECPARDAGVPDEALALLLAAQPFPVED